MQSKVSDVLQLLSGQSEDLLIVVNIVSIVAELKISHAVLNIAYLMVFRAVKVLIPKFQLGIIIEIPAVTFH